MMTKAQRGEANEVKSKSSKVEVELLEATAHGPTAGALCNPAAVLFTDQSLDTSWT